MTLEQLQTQHDTLIDSLDLPRTMTGRQVDAYETHRQGVIAKLSYAKQNAVALAKANASISTLEPLLRQVEGWRAALAQHLLAMPQLHAIDAAKRERLQACIDACDFGAACVGDAFHLTQSPLGKLMLASGFTASTPEPFQVCGALTFPGSIPVLQAKLKILYAEKVDAEGRLAEALHDLPGLVPA